MVFLSLREELDDERVLYKLDTYCFENGKLSEIWYSSTCTCSQSGRLRYNKWYS